MCGSEQTAEQNRRADDLPINYATQATIEAALIDGKPRCKRKRQTGSIGSHYKRNLVSFQQRKDEKHEIYKET